MNNLKILINIITIKNLTFQNLLILSFLDMKTRRENRLTIDEKFYSTVLEYEASELNFVD